MAVTTATLLNRKEAGIRLGISIRTIDELIASGDLPVVRLGRAVRIRPAALDDLIEARETRTNPKKKGGA